MVIYLVMNLFSSRALHHLNLGGKSKGCQMAR
jgi:hypothetical protein